MNNLEIDLNLMLELSLSETRGEGECYLNLNDGEFSYIPQSIIEALKDESKFDKLEGWEKELAIEAEDITMNYSDNYLYIPLIDEVILVSAMKNYLNILNPNDKSEISNKVDWSNPLLTFNRVLINKDKLDEFYTFRDEFLINYLIDWLKEKNINVAK
ncbi:hypothetical protein [Clostridium sp. UBA1056]|uniref:hypothetical protein n=1 Tax=unclassified Clostridium TaxID=2614128 RepID=UPI0032179758